MKKATATTQKTTTPAAGGAVALGTKRACPKCATKFYDFNKEPPVCPKCQAEVDLAASATPAKSEPPPKRSKAAEKENAEESVLATDESADTSTDDFESVEDLEDDEDDIAEIEADEADEL